MHRSSSRFRGSRGCHTFGAAQGYEPLADTMKVMRKTTILPFVPVALIAGAAAAAPVALKRRMVPPARPSVHTPGDYGVAGRDVWLDGPNGRKLHGWHVPRPGEAPAVVVLHGWGGNASVMLPLARPLNHAGFHAFFLDARGHGHSEADDHASMLRFAEDLEIAIDWLVQQPRVASIGVIGHSIGAGATILAASRNRTIDAVVSVSGLADVWEVLRDQTAIRRLPTAARRAVRRTMERVMGVTLEEIAPERVVERVLAPVLVVHGTDDEIIPPEHAERLATAAGAELILIEGGTHADLAAFEPHLGKAFRFLRSHLTR